MIPLTDRVTEWSADATPALISPGGTISRAALAGAVQHTEKRLQDAPAGKWALHCGDAGSFAVAFLALLRSGREPLVLPHRQPDLLRELSESGLAFLSETPSDGFEGRQITLDHNWPAGPDSWPTLTESCRQFSLYTSGSSGLPELVTHSLASMEAELEIHEEAFGKKIKGATVFSTVDHQHLYGLLWWVLGPLRTGRPFYTELLHFPEEVNRAIGGQKRCMLVSSPAFLKRASEQLDDRVFSTHCTAIFSSGGPLQAEIAADLNRRLGPRMIELYGSTETGGVAHRCVIRAEDPAHWQTLPGVEIRIVDDLIEVSAPQIEDQGWFRTKDRGELHEDGSFTLLGRVDRIAKVEEKRINVSEMERFLLDHPMVEGAHVLELPDGGNRPLAAVVVPNQAGWQTLQADGKIALREILKEHLVQRFESVTLPRRWRFVTGVSEDAQGKVSQASLSRLFERFSDNDLPAIRQIEVDGDRCSASLFIGSSLNIFDGHFPNLPVVPGVAELSWVDHFAREAYGDEISFAAIEALKFRRLLRPGTTCTLDLSYDREIGRIEFLIKDGEDVFCSGRLLIEKNDQD